MEKMTNRLYNGTFQFAVFKCLHFISVQVCDFGLSRLKARTFLSSKSAAGTVSSWICRNILPHSAYKMSMQFLMFNYAILA